ncbi:MAG: TIGR00299 family protein [Spirochaetes bacterium GWD1_27_9]|nr:MAG: TIGR00299 family protein [Spirochaetes bacterium GWC1_27_15]OHD41514.1 MAG: TIGR00299 family protein [Spirochaetes bacterium GWD1_27_9]
MAVLYIDAFSGISGDKMVSALLSLNENFEYLKKELKTLNIEDEYKLELTKKIVMGIDSNYFKVVLTNEEPHNHEEEHHHHDDHHHHEEKHNHHHHEEHSHHTHQEEKPHFHRNLTSIVQLIDDSKITENAKKIAKEIFRIVGEAEAKVHNKPIDEVHFHEVGAVDSIIDIVSVGILIDKLKIDTVYCSFVPFGNGFINVAHGVLPVPAPATAEILTGVPTYQGDVKGELTTPTGAAIVKYLVKDYKNQPSMIIDKIGYGAGTKEFPIPNVLKVCLGQLAEDNSNDNIIKIETNIDDCSPEQIAFLVEKLFEKNALDVFSTPIIMKKGRLATELTVLCYQKDCDSIEREIFLNSTTFGIRKSFWQRTILSRKFETIKVENIDIRIKLGFLDGKLIQKSIEYEDIKKLSNTLNISYNEAKEKIEKEIKI